jgi:hypothetical protein
MSSSNYGCSADIVTPEFVKEQCPIEYGTLFEMLTKADVTLTDFFLAKHFESDYENIADEADAEMIEFAWGVLIAAFNEKTGLELGTVYHDAEERSDELNGGAFKVDGVHGYTAAGEKFKEHIEHKDWTIFG